MDYIKMQTGGPIIKPVHYHVGEWEAMKFLIGDKNKNLKVLDVGCGIGYGVGMFNKLGFDNVLGIDINSDKYDLGKTLGYNVIFGNILGTAIPSRDFIDVIWCSHSFEHMLYPEKVLNKLIQISSDTARFYFILPYPDLKPSPVHCAVDEIGTNVDDNGDTVVKWFEDRGLRNIIKTFSSFREPEIWLEFRKI